MNRPSLMVFIVLTTMTVSTQAQTPRELNDLVDSRASSGERQLEERGYRHSKSMQVRESSIGYWWNARRGQCIAVTTRDGRFSSILEQPDSVCGDTGRAADRDDRRHHGDRGDLKDLVGMRAGSGERELKDRGYYHRNTVTFGGGKIAYWWNPGRQRCIAVNTNDGRYTSVVDQSESMCSDDRANSGGKGGFAELVGMRASSGERKLQELGYQSVNSTRGDGRIWTNWWNRSQNKCITVVTMDGRYDAVTETMPVDCGRR